VFIIEKRFSTQTKRKERKRRRQQPFWKRIFSHSFVLMPLCFWYNHWTYG